MITQDLSGFPAVETDEVMIDNVRLNREIAVCLICGLLIDGSLGDKNLIFLIAVLALLSSK